MKRTLRDLWVATLRSGNYKQGRGSLRTKDNRCCCLGVLCDIIDPKRWAPEAVDDDGQRFTFGQTGGYLTFEQCQEFGISTNIMGELAKLNDEGKSFKDIAKAILEMVPVED